MDSSLDHLPPVKRAELAKLARLIQDACKDVEMVILFGSYARGDWKEQADLPPRAVRRSGHASDYDILAVTAGHAAAADSVLWNHVNTKALRLGLSTYARVIAYDIQALNERLADGRYFYTDIKKEGRVLYDSGRFKLAEAKEMSPEERRRIAQEYYDHWFTKAEVFFEDYEISLNKSPQQQKYLNQAAFYLHQAAEAAYKTTLLVFTAYSPDEHYLKLLGEMAAMHDPSLAAIFPSETEEQQDRFRLLEYAYIGARYDAAYRVSAADLEFLAACVKNLLDRTREICTEALKQ